MQVALKQAIFNYIKEHDPKGDVVATFSVEKDWSAGEIKYNWDHLGKIRECGKWSDDVTGGAEELVRAYLLVRLATELAYPLNKSMILEEPYSIGHPSKKDARLDVKIEDIICFNSGFDLSRIAVDWETAKNGGWSLILSKWRNPRTRELKPNKFFPRIVVKALNSKTSIIHSTRAPMSERRGKTKKVKLWPSSRFLDVRTLLWALRNKSYSLRSAAEEFKTQHRKLDHKPTGKVTIPEIRYAREDVACTVDLLNAAIQEFELHPIAAGPDRMFSPASVAKQYLDQLNIAYPSKKVTNAYVEYGIFMQSYYGGRAEWPFALSNA